MNATTRPVVTAGEVRSRLSGPIPTLRTPFTRDGEMDFAALDRMIDFVIEAGAPSVVLTAGDSHLKVLSDRQIGDLTKRVIARVAGRAMVVAADCDFHTRQSIEFADFVRELGGDMLMVLPPLWAKSATPESLADHYAAVAAHIPVMVVTGVFSAVGAEFAMRCMAAVMARTDNVLAVKDDLCGEAGRALTALVGERMAVWAGGQKKNHLNIAGQGATGYLSTFLTFRPELAWRYWRAFTSGDTATVEAVVRDYDAPLFDFITSGTLAGGFDAPLHGILELCGLAERWRPAPYHSLTDAEMAVLAAFVRERGMNPCG